MADTRFCFILTCSNKPTWLGVLHVKKDANRKIDVAYCDDHAFAMTKKTANTDLRMVLTPAPKPEFQDESVLAAHKFKRNDIVKDDQGNHFLVVAVKGSRCTVESVVTKERFVGRKRIEFTKTDRVAM